jgi:hypothetical protein
VHIFNLFILNLLENWSLVCFSCLCRDCSSSAFSHSLIQVSTACKEYVATSVIVNNLLYNLSSGMRLWWIHIWIIRIKAHSSSAIHWLDRYLVLSLNFLWRLVIGIVLALWVCSSWRDTLSTVLRNNKIICTWIVHSEIKHKGKFNFWILTHWMC